MQMSETQVKLCAGGGFEKFATEFLSDKFWPSPEITKNNFP